MYVHVCLVETICVNTSSVGMVKCGGVRDKLWVLVLTWFPLSSALALQALQVVIVGKLIKGLS